MQKRGCLLQREAQIGGANVLRLSSCSPSEQGQWRFAACQEHHMQRRGKMIDEKSHSFVDSWLCNDMVIIQDEEAIAHIVDDIIEQECQHRL